MQRLEIIQNSNPLWRSNDEMLEEAKDEILLTAHEEPARNIQHMLMRVFDSMLELQKSNQKLAEYYDRAHNELHKQAVECCKDQRKAAVPSTEIIETQSDHS